jgi:hypothetical protein
LRREHDVAFYEFIAMGQFVLLIHAFGMLLGIQIPPIFKFFILYFLREFESSINNIAKIRNVDF